MTVAFADDLMQLATKIEDTVVWMARAQWQMQQNHTPSSSGYAPDFYMDSDLVRKYFGITDAFRPWSLLPDPAAFQPVTDSLLQAMGMLRVDAEFGNPVDPSDQFGMARQEFQALVNTDPINNWSGATADGFRTKFLDHFKANTENEVIMIAVLKAAAEAQRAVWFNARNDVTTIGQKTLAALQNDGCDQSSWVMAFSILAGIASIAAVPLTGGASLAGLSVTAIGAVGSIATNAIPYANGTDSMSYSGSSLQGAITAMKSAMAGLQQRVESGQVAIDLSLTANLVFLETEMGSLFQMAKPTLASGPDFTPGR
ncbi:MAG TPA: hypothetical protein VG247_29355 [Pseudonocardiaceae bacterium]|nr:hypothetical protein [Pseudonocardiaceae bacterium]